MITPAILKKMRKDAGMTQLELSAAVNFSQAHIAKIEGGKVDPRLSTVNKILNVLSGRTKTLCGDVMTEKFFTVKPSDKVTDAVLIMQRRDISQLPVVDGCNMVGVMTESDVMSQLDDIENKLVSQVMSKPLPQVEFSTPLDSIKSLFDVYPAIIITRSGKPIGILTKSDLIKARTE
jgi:predicted transcriptional regulator